MKFADVSAKISKKVKCLPKIVFSIDIMDLYVLPCFCILFKRRLKNVTKGFVFNVVLANLKISEPIDYSCTVNIWWNVVVQSGMQTIEKRNLSFLSLGWALKFLSSIMIERSESFQNTSFLKILYIHYIVFIYTDKYSILLIYLNISLSCV